MTLHADITFPAMGSETRVVVGPALAPGLPDPDEAAAAARAWARQFDLRLSRFVADSELCGLNTDPRTVVPASELLCTAVTAGLWAAERSGGLVDPTLLGELEAAGYETTRRDAKPARLERGADRRSAAPSGRRQPGEPLARDPRAARARRDRAPARRALRHRRHGKGLAADALAQRLDGYAGVAIDCGGDIRLAGRRPGDPPFDVGVAHPLSGTIVHHLALGGGGVATSGLDVNVWRCEDGSYAHHLIDPATGEPAWTGVISATAVAPSALEAETLAKAAILSGPRAARALLADHGGVLFFDDGAFDIVAGRTPAVVRLPRPKAKVTA